MLVLSRKPGETIVIDDRIHIMVARMSHSRVRLVIDAPKDTSVDRHEVWLRKHQEQITLQTQRPK